MKIELTADAYEDALPNEIFNELYDKGFSEYFFKKDYGNNEVELFIVIICYPKDLNIRKRYDSKEKILYWDVIIDYQTIKNAEKNRKKSILAENIISSFDVLDKYKKLHLDKGKLKNNAREFFISIKWLK